MQDAKAVLVRHRRDPVVKRREQKLSNPLVLMVGATGIETVTPPVCRECSPAELRARQPTTRWNIFIGHKPNKQYMVEAFVQISSPL